MYRTIQHQMSIDDYLPPYEGELVQENRWVRLAQAIDWDAIEQEYSGHFAAGGKVAIPARMAFGVLVIRAACRTTDSETVEIVRESPYLQYFLDSSVQPSTAMSQPCFFRSCTAAPNFAISARLPCLMSS